MKDPKELMEEEERVMGPGGMTRQRVQHISHTTWINWRDLKAESLGG